MSILSSIKAKTIFFIIYLGSFITVFNIQSIEGFNDLNIFKTLNISIDYIYEYIVYALIYLFYIFYIIKIKQYVKNKINDFYSIQEFLYPNLVITVKNVLYFMFLIVCIVFTFWVIPTISKTELIIYTIIIFALIFPFIYSNNSYENYEKHEIYLLEFESTLRMIKNCFIFILYAIVFISFIEANSGLITDNNHLVLFSLLSFILINEEL